MITYKLDLCEFECVITSFVHILAPFRGQPFERSTWKPGRDILHCPIEISVSTKMIDCVNTNALGNSLPKTVQGG